MALTIHHVQDVPLHALSRGQRRPVVWAVDIQVVVDAHLHGIAAAITHSAHLKPGVATVPVDCVSVSVGPGRVLVARTQRQQQQQQRQRQQQQLLGVREQQQRLELLRQQRF